MQELLPEALSLWLCSDRPKPILLDVREPWEFEICHVEGAQLMPMSMLSTQISALDEEAEIVVICHHGMRSQHVGMFLERHGFAHIYNLQGGMDRWAAEVDPTMPVY
jgi:rhodanese-related sulfurtransferase